MSLYILDSDHLSLFQRGHEPLKAHILSVPPEQIVITVISVEELVRGRFAQIRKSSQSVERVLAYPWLSETVQYLCSFRTIEYDAAAEEQFQDLRKQKVKVGSQDLKIGAITLTQNATLVTRNRQDFEQIPAIKIEDWSMS